MKNNNIGLIGYGRIGTAIKYYLEQEKFQVTPYDSYVLGAVPLDASNPSALASIIPQHDAIIAATPFTLNVEIARQCALANVPYFDITEDVAVTKAVMDFVKDAPNWWAMPQCGLAPGAVSIIAKQMLTDDFVSVDELELRVGALPRTGNNKMKYYLTWSSEGLINEYCNDCDAFVDRQETKVKALEGEEEIIIDGQVYEAFNTSGGIGTLITTLKEQPTCPDNITYKTIRYKGHRDYMKFLLDDLGLRKNYYETTARGEEPLLVKIFNTEVPETFDDVIIICIQVTGITKDDLYRSETYTKKIYSDKNFTAIQRTTALGLCAAVYWWAVENPQVRGFVTNESITGLESNPYWGIFSNGD